MHAEGRIEGCSRSMIGPHVGMKGAYGSHGSVCLEAWADIILDRIYFALLHTTHNISKL